jgi:ankyrin repeat protein
MTSNKLLSKTIFLILAIGFLTTSNLFAQDESEDPLRSAVLYKEIDEVRKILNEGAEMNRQDKNGYTPLIHACTYCSNENYREKAKLLIASGADVNIQAHDGNTAIIEAAGNSHEIFNLLLARGADLNAKKEDGTGAYYNCMIHLLLYGRPVTEQDLERVEFLLTSGADVDECPVSGDLEGYTPLMFASRENNEEVVNNLIKHGANVNAKNMEGDSPLSLANKEGHSNIAEILRAHGAK